MTADSQNLKAVPANQMPRRLPQPGVDDELPGVSVALEPGGEHFILPT